MPPRDPTVTYFGISDFRNKKVPFGMRQNDRFFHAYVIGKTGTGKSTLIQTFARQDIQDRRGFALFDPHGDLHQSILSSIPPRQ